MMTYLQLVILYTATMIRRVVRSALGVRHLTVTTTVVVVIAVLLLRRVLFSPTEEELSHQELLNYVGEFVQAKYVQVKCGSGVDPDLSGDAPSSLYYIRLMNVGVRPVVGGGWTIYFNHADGFLEMDDDGDLAVQHVDGWLFRLTLRPGRTLRPFSNVTTSNTVRLASRSYAFPRWYTASTDDSSLVPRVLRATDSESVDFVTSFGRHSSRRVTSSARYDKHDVIADLGGPAKPVIPTPLSVQRRSPHSWVSIGTQWTISHQTELLREARLLSERLGLRSVEVKPDSRHPTESAIVLRLDDIQGRFNEFINTTSSLHVDEAYIITTTPGSDASTTGVVDVVGQSSAGVFYGVQTLLSLLTADDSGRRRLVAGEVADAPRFSYRGLMLDVARNFVEKDVVLRTIDAMAAYKMNQLHLHLTDDQGWRFGVPDVPELTAVGGRRGHESPSNGGPSMLLPYLGSGPSPDDAATNGGSGFYSREDYRDILRHARQRYVTVIPEVDVPGHSAAAIVSMRAQKSDRGQENFTLVDPNDSVEYMSVNLYKNNVMNPCLTSSLTFVEHIIKTLIELHKDVQPLSVIHVGGDEVNAEAYRSSANCTRRKLNVEQLKQEFMGSVIRRAARLGVAVQAWDDALAAGDERPRDAKHWTDDKRHDIYINAWNNNRLSNAFTYADAGYKVILSHATHLYLDHPYEPDFDEPGLFWATSHIDTRKVFEYLVPTRRNTRDPRRLRRVCDQYWMDDCAPPNALHNIVGVQASLWTEMVRSSERLDYMLFPRLLAVAERAWHEADWQSAETGSLTRSRRTHDWEQFANTVGYRELRNLEHRGIKYRLPPPGLRKNGREQIHVNTEFPGLTVVASTDSGHTWTEHPVGASRMNTTLMLLATRSFDGRRRSRAVVV